MGSTVVISLGTSYAFADFLSRPTGYKNDGKSA
jgi:hypothetical protein